MQYQYEVVRAETQSVAGGVTCTQFVPELTEVQIPPPLMTAANFVPSADDAMDCQFSPGAPVNPQLVPASLEVQTPLPYVSLSSAAARFIPFEDEAIEDQPALGALPCIQFVPELLELQMPPPLMTAANFVPSDDEAMEYQYTFVGALVFNQFVPELAEVQIPPTPPSLGIANASFVPSDEEARKYCSPPVPLGRALVCAQFVPPLLEE